MFDAMKKIKDKNNQRYFAETYNYTPSIGSNYKPTRLGEFVHIPYIENNIDDYMPTKTDQLTNQELEPLLEDREMDMKSGISPILIKIYGPDGKSGFFNTPSPLRSMEKVVEGSYIDKNVKTIILPKSVKLIGENAFKDFKNLRRIIIPNGVTEIGESAFEGCSNLKEIIIPNGVTKIGDWAFEGCYSLQKLVIPNSVTEIGEHAFQNRYTSGEVVIPDYVTKLDKHTPLFLPTDLFIKPKELTIPIKLFGNLYPYVVQYLEKLDVTGNISLVGSLSRLRMLKELVIHSNPKIHSKIFQTCPKLEKITITKDDSEDNDNNDNAFSQIENTSISKGVTEIGDNCFKDYSKLEKVSISKTVNRIGDGAFQNCEQLKKISIPKNVNHIGKSTFQGCEQLTKVTIPNNVTKIDDNAFKGCKNLKKVVLSNNLKSIGKSAFEGCDNLQWVTPSACGSFFKSLFGACFSLSNVQVPESLTEIGESAFESCPKIRKATIPNRVELGKGSFDINCKIIGE